jgi:hypothetical protein
MPASLDQLSLSRLDFVGIERDLLQDNIILLDAKSAALLALSGVLLFHCIDRAVQLTSAAASPVASLVLGLYLAASLSLVATTAFCWFAIKPRIVKADDHLYWGSKLYLGSAETFVSQIKSADADVIADELLRLIHTLAGICRRKFAAFEHAVWATELSLLLVLAAECESLLFADRLVRG